MEIRLETIAEMVGGELHGDGQGLCRGANPPGQTSPDQLTMLADAEAGPGQLTAPALAVITPQRLETIDVPQIVVADPHVAFAKVVALFRPPVAPTLPGVGVDSNASIASSAKLHPTATVGAGTSIGARSLIMPGVVILPGCTIGEDCIVYPGVTLYEHTRVADRVVIHASAVIGAHGFGYRQHQGRHVPQAQLGYVEIEADVEIGAGVTIDRGSYGATRIGEGTKIDNQVMIGHNCQIGRHNLICSQVGIAGSCRTGDYVVLAGQVGLKDHITLEDHTVVGAKAGVMEDCQGHQVYLGAPAMPQRDQMQIFALQRKLPEMRKELKALRKELDRLSRTAAAPVADSPVTVEAKRAA
jgi:UDP-3-O-[3-hydroxymyristoyl] glucosamine N-acyltransferase